jgi:hypothetical protein
MQEVVAQRAAPVIYGVDDRIELRDAPEGTRAIFEGALVALVPETRIRVLGSGDALIDTEALGVKQGLCTGTRFSDEPSAATCSGTLVTENLVLTARHCVTNLEQCRLLRWVFGYAYATNGELAPFGPDDVYGCQRIVAAGFDRDQNLDFAWVELDRPVRGRRPLPALARGSALAPGSRLLAAGFGQGIPAKFDPNVEVLASFENYFTATLDAFTGSSGMPLVTAEGTFVGFALRGEDDYVTVGGCKVPQNLGAGCEGCAYGGEQVAYLQPALDALRAAQMPDAGLQASATTTDIGMATDAGIDVDAAREINQDPAPNSDASTGQDAPTIPLPEQAPRRNQAVGDTPNAGLLSGSGLSCSVAHVPSANRDHNAWWLLCWGLVAWAAGRRRQRLSCRSIPSPD